MKEHLTREELLLSLKYCMDYMGEGSCTGCPNAIPDTADEHGICKCRFRVMDEMIHALETIVQEQKG